MAHDTTPIYDRLVDAGFPALERPYFYRIEERSELSAIAVQLRVPARRRITTADPEGTDGYVDEVVLDMRTLTPHVVLQQLAELVREMVYRHRTASTLVGDHGPAVTA